MRPWLGRPDQPKFTSTGGGVGVGLGEDTGVGVPTGLGLGVGPFEGAGFGATGPPFPFTDCTHSWVAHGLGEVSGGPLGAGKPGGSVYGETGVRPSLFPSGLSELPTSSQAFSQTGPRPKGPQLKGLKRLQTIEHGVSKKGMSTGVIGGSLVMSGSGGELAAKPERSWKVPGLLRA